MKRIRTASFIVYTLWQLSQSFAAADTVKDVSFDSHGVTLSGSIVTPDSPAFAAMVWVDGSGNDTRNLDLAHSLAKEGLAVIVYDKRGVGKSGGEYWGTDPKKPNIARSNIELLADDAVAAMKVLNDYEPHVPAGFIGGSQAGWIIPIAANNSYKTRFIGLWSGAVTTVSEQLHFQAMTANEPNFWGTYTEAEVDAALTSTIPREDDVDPRSSLSRLKVPGIWFFGDKDRFVPVALSVRNLDALKANGHKYEYKVIPDRGHQVVGSGSSAYQEMIDWIRKTVPQHKPVN